MVKLVLAILLNCSSMLGFSIESKIEHSEITLEKCVYRNNVAIPMLSKFENCKFEQSDANLTFEIKL